MEEKTKNKNPMINVMSLRDFRLLLAGSATSLLGDQLVLIATPWLVLQMTGDPLVLGIILAMEGIPRALFMLLGGAITDRLTPRLVMFISDVIRFVLTGLMALVLFSGVIQIWMLYAFGLGFGLVAGFAIPAQTSIVPLIVKKKDLQAGNSIIMGITQLAGFIGPTAAGIIIGGFAGSSFGIGLAFAADAVTFAVSAVCLWLISSEKKDSNADTKENIWTSILTGIKYLWNDKTMRVMFFVVSAINFLFVGPFLVGIPVLANQRLPEGALAFGLLMSAVSGGNLLGFILAGALPKPAASVMKYVIIGVLGAFGAFMVLLGFISNTWIAAALLAILGLGNGYIAILFFTWIQKQTPKEMLGRMMSILIFANTGLIPVSQAISGAICKWDLTLLFTAAGILILIVTISAALHPGIKSFSESLTQDNKEAVAEV